MAVPVYFEMLDNNSGNSSAADRIELLKTLIAIVRKDRIRMLVMDREFIGHKWLSWLKKVGIPFCVRVPKNHTILLPDGDKVRAEEVMQQRNRPYYQQNVVVDGVVVNLSLSYNKNGELLYLIGTAKPQALASSYKKRWSVEVFFQALKQRGFNIEDSSLRCLEKYRKLFALVSIAYTLCWATGIQEGKRNPVKTKKHGYPQYSVFRRGLILMRQCFKKKVLQPVLVAIEEAWDRFNHFYKTVG